MFSIRGEPVEFVLHHNKFFVIYSMNILNAYTEAKYVWELSTMVFTNNICKFEWNSVQRYIY